MLKYVLVFMLCFYLCAANELSETGRKKGNFLLYGGGLLYYLTFLIVKIKIIAVVGTLITVALVAGKVYAFYKYLTIVDAHHHIEPIYAEPPHSTGYSTPYFNKEVYLDHPPYEADHDHHHSFELDHDPNSFQGSHDHQPYADSPGSHDKTYSSTGYSNNYHARKIENIADIADITTKIFRRLKLSELAFDAMHIKSEECKRRFMCEAYVQAENSKILAIGLSVLNDTSQDKYRPEKSASTLEECQKTYSQCKETPEG